jgi:hypothetical protein
MEPTGRRTKKLAKKSHLNTEKTAGQAEKKAPAVPTSYSTSWRDEEELVDYKPESPPSFSPTVEKLSEPEDFVRTPVPGQANNSTSNDDFCANPVEDAAMGERGGRKRRQNLQQPSAKMIFSKTNRQPFLGRVVSPLFLLSGTRVWQTYRGPPQGKVSPQVTKTNRQPFLGTVVSPLFLLSGTIIWQTYR